MRYLLAANSNRDHSINSVHGEWARLVGCMTVVFGGILLLTWLGLGGWWLLAVSTILASLGGGGRLGVALYMVIGAVIIHFTAGTWWVLLGFAAPFCGFANEATVTAESTTRFELG